MRSSISLVVIAFALAGSASVAAAQYYPPPPPGYLPAYPAPGYPMQTYSATPLPEPGDVPQANPSQGGPYGHAPFVYRDASGAPYDPRYDDQAPPMGGPYEPAPVAAGAGGMAPQPLPSMAGAPFARPPAGIGGASPDITGTIRAPAAAAPVSRAPAVAGLPPEDQPEQGAPKQLAPQFRRQVVGYMTTEPAGTIIIDTPHTYLYLALGNGKAVRYGIGVGREGFTWAGSERISRMKEWPDWFPPKEMIERQPYLPRFMAGGDTNPLGARALYLGSTLYRIHGTNQPSTIGTFVSSGCIRLTNDDISDLYTRVNVGTRVVVLPGASSLSASAQRSLTQ